MNREAPAGPAPVRNATGDRLDGHGTVLVVGASGILAPLVRDLLRGGGEVLAVGRRRDPLGALHRSAGCTDRLVSVAADTSTNRGAAAVLEAAARLGGVDHAVIYGPTATEETLAGLMADARSRSVLILTSAAAAPDVTTGLPSPSPFNRTALADHHRTRPGDGILLLGWTTRRPGAAAAWHRPAEVSAAAMAALEGPRDIVLGVVRPWSSRPR